MSSSNNGSVRMRSVAMPEAQTALAAPSLKVVSMAKREEELVGIRKMSDEDINQTVVDLKGELFLLRSKQATRQEYKSSEFRRIRKQVGSCFSLLLMNSCFWNSIGVDVWSTCLHS